MLNPLIDIENIELSKLLATQYNAIVKDLEFQPLGEDSWNYASESLWLSIRRELRGHEPRAYNALATLSAVGLEFVLAPLAGIDGEYIHYIRDHPVLVFPRVDCVGLDVEAPIEAERQQLVEIFGQLHSTGLDLDLPRESNRLSFFDDLSKVLHKLSEPPITAGPLSQCCFELASDKRSTITELIMEFRELAQQNCADPAPLVLTHGEPTDANILKCNDKLLVADWGELSWAPPEKDWFHIERTLGISPNENSHSLRDSFMRQYSVYWQLSEITEYTTILLSKHQLNNDTRAMWKRLQWYL